MKYAAPSTRLEQWLREATTAIAGKGLDAPRLCAELIAAHVLGLERTTLLLRRDSQLDALQLAAMQGLLARRLEHEPMAYILGQREFYSRMFAVTPHTLIPRPDTEGLVDFLCERFAPDSHLCFADFGTGSGAIAVTMALERPEWQGIMVDVSAQALHCAVGNSKRLGTAARLCAVQADFSTNFMRPESVDVLISNPPYISEREYAGLEPQVKLFEPKEALVPCRVVAGKPKEEGRDGYEAYWALAIQANRILRPGGLLCVECGWQQAQQIELLFLRNNLKNPLIIRDLAGVERFVCATRSVV